MSNISRSKNPKWTKTARNTIRNFLRSRTKMFHLSKPIIKNPKWDEKSLINTVPEFIVAPIKGRTFRNPRIVAV